MLTQYLIAFLWAVQVVWLLTRTLHTRRRGDASSWRWLAAYALAVVLYLPWLPHAIDQFRHNVLPSLKGMFGPGRLAELVTAWLTGLDASHLTGFVTLGLLAVAGVLLWSRPRVAAAWRPLVLMWVAPAIVLIVVAAIREPFYAPYGGFFTVRYSCAFLPFVYATMGLVVAGLALRRWNDGGDDGNDGGDGNANRRGGSRTVRIWFRRWGAWIVVVAMMALCDMGLAVHGNVVYEKGYVPHARQAATAAPCSPDVAVVAADPYTYIDAVAYYRGCANYWLIEPEDGIPTRGGYAPLAEVAHSRTIRSLGDLPDGMDAVTVLVSDGQHPGSFAGTPPGGRYGADRRVHGAAFPMSVGKRWRRGDVNRPARPARASDNQITPIRPAQRYSANVCKVSAEVCAPYRRVVTKSVSFLPAQCVISLVSREADASLLVISLLRANDYGDDIMNAVHED